MRFLVTADLHVNQTMRSAFDKEAGMPASWVEAFARLNEIVDIAHENDVEHIVIGGDLWDDGTPTPENVALLKDAFNRLRPGIKVWIVEGNHEHRGITGGHRSPIEVYLSDQSWCGGVFTTVDKVDIGGVELVLAPWWRVSGTDSLETDSAALDNAIKAMYDKVTKPSLLVGHLTVAEADFRNKEARSAENLIRDSILEALVPASTLENGPWSAALLGHVHRAQSFGAKTRYVGSSYPITFGEGVKSVEIVDLEENGDISTRKVTLKHRMMDVVDLSDDPKKKLSTRASMEGVAERYSKGDMVRVILEKGQLLTPDEDDTVRRLKDKGVLVFTRVRPSAKDSESVIPSVSVSDISLMSVEDTMEEWLKVNSEGYNLDKSSQKRVYDRFTDVLNNMSEE